MIGAICADNERHKKVFFSRTCVFVDCGCALKKDRLGTHYVHSCSTGTVGSQKETGESR
jgi:hypothetical protein